MFNIPIVLFVFKRKDTVIKIFERISIIQPRKIYIISDQGRSEDEKKLVKDVRDTIETLIDWDCEIVRNYAVENRGVHENIGLGAKWVFEKEESAIFLEDDNLPEVTFFKYCETLLEKYKEEERVMWICGTNYLGKYQNVTGDSYMFTQNLLPCGWASWSEKYLKYYDANFDTVKNESDLKKIKKNYKNMKLYKQQFFSIGGELNRKNMNERYRSWDYQMAYSLRYYNLLGISPCYNQIKNIGVDEMSEHGGTSLNMVMTQRFCEVESFSLEFPLRHPDTLIIDRKYENKIDSIILLPLRLRLKSMINRTIKRIVGINIYQPMCKERK